MNVTSLLSTAQVTMEARAMTKVTATPMPRAVSVFLDTPMKGQMPRNFTKMKLLVRMAPRAMARREVTFI